MACSDSAFTFWHGLQTMMIRPTTGDFARALVIKDGTEAQASVAGGKFSFSKGASTKQQVGRHVITADGDLVLVHELDGTKDATGSAAVKESAAVACFRAPGRISVLDCAGDQIAVGCEDGDVLHLRAALLMQGASGHK